MEMILASILHTWYHIISIVQKYTFFFTYKTFSLFFINKVIKHRFFLLSDIDFFSICSGVQAGSFGSIVLHLDI